jgi:formylglycine-generating enzyme required for sulfatase activity
MKLTLSIVILALFNLFLNGCKKDTVADTESLGSIGGKISDAGTGNSIAGVTLETQPATSAVVSDGAGGYIISNVAAGQYQLSATMSGYMPKVVSVTVTAGNTTPASIAMTKAIAINNPPATPSNPTPANSATGVTTSPTLSWVCNDPEGDTLTYDVLFGTSSTPTTQVATGQSGTTFERTGLANSATYYWKIVAKDSKGATTSGPVWSFTTYSSSIMPGMVSVAGGTFTTGFMPVTISSFKIDMYEVTYELWTDVRNWALTHGYSGTDLAVGGNGYAPIGVNNPVTNVSWYDIVKWCNARSEKEGLTPVYHTAAPLTANNIYRTGQTGITTTSVDWTANGYRLPTEVEWEFAAKGGNLTHNYIFSGSDTLDVVAWHRGNNPPYNTHTVGTKAANELGIYDMSGNVWEWCWDSFSSTYPSGGTIDPKGPAWTQSDRLLRGGSFLVDGDVCRVTFRNASYPLDREDYVGFRCVHK